MSLYKNYFKRIFDFVAALIFLIIASPLLLLGLLIIYISSRTFDIFFLQLRPGKNSKLFKVIKLKTMSDIYDKEGVLLPDSERITKVGKFLRDYSIDELPQFINVIKGDMSLIGPRPLLPEYLPKYTQEQARRHEMRPGISGWAQINGRNTSTFTQRFKDDVWYVDNATFLLDIKIVGLTFFKVFKSDGVMDQDPNSMIDNN